ncbi:MAG: EF2563 family selenium-dependent molybdenum hydroxylase system protein [Dehalococcoidales bacterium]|nr:EF2563 family selenium-dependent molybdenum hydroxylase system protein [Dehalococcoidales bacterium]
MRKLSELIVLIRGGGEVGSAIAQRMVRSHFRVCITEIASPLAIHRGCSFSETVFDTRKKVEDIASERIQPSLEYIYRAWRNGNLPVVVDPELSVKPLLKPDVLVNAMMLRRKTNTTMEDAALVIGIGPGFTAGEDVHLVIETHPGYNLGRVLIEGCAEDENDADRDRGLVLAEEAGVFTTQNNIGDAVLAGDEIGRLNDLPVNAPLSGVMRGILRDQIKVLSHTRLAEIDPGVDRSACFSIRDSMRAVAGGVLEAIMMSFNIEGE